MVLKKAEKWPQSHSRAVKGKLLHHAVIAPSRAVGTGVPGGLEGLGGLEPLIFLKQ